MLAPSRNDGGRVHGFFTMGKLLLQANIAVSEIGAWLKALDQLHPTGNRR
jgi:acetyl esterase